MKLLSSWGKFWKPIAFPIFELILPSNCIIFSFHYLECLETGKSKEKIAVSISTPSGNASDPWRHWDACSHGSGFFSKSNTFREQLENILFYIVFLCHLGTSFCLNFILFYFLNILQHPLDIDNQVLHWSGL